MTDDQGWGDVGYNGHPVIKTPVLDEMAATGLRLDRFYAAAPVCSPTRGSVLTGRHPNRFACFQWGHTLRPQEVTIAQLLRKAGYATGHFGKWHLGSVVPEDPASPGSAGFDEWISSPNFYVNDPLLSHRGKVIETKGEGSMVTVEVALPFIRDAARRGQPFLAVIWFGSPHLPHEATDELRALYPNHDDAHANYYGEVTGVDRAMGRLRRELRDLGIADDTLLWFTSDNGSLPPGSTGGLRGRKDQIWEGGIRVPCVIEWPGRVRTPMRSEAPAFTSDIFPTLLQIAGLQPPDDRPLDGVSIRPLLDGRAMERRKPMGFWRYPAPGHRTPATQILQDMLAAQREGRRYDYRKDFPGTPSDPLDTFPGHAAWLDWPWKLHRIEAKDGGEARTELYNLAEDATESRDLAQSEGPRVQAMRAALEVWLTSVVRSLNGEDYPTSRP